MKDKDLFNYLYSNYPSHMNYKEVFSGLIPLIEKLNLNINELDWIKFLAFKEKVPEEFIDNFINSFHNLEIEGSYQPDLEKINEDLKWIQQQPQHEQRTPEWFEFRSQLITASSLYKIFGTPSVKNSLLKEKTNAKPKTTNIKMGTACQHGVICEPIAQRIYECEKNSKIKEYGCIQHRTVHHIGASPDGIVEETNDPYMLGRMLEIKCVYTRNITGIPPYHYWIQIQTQLEVCNLEYCDLLECYIETIDKDEFFNGDLPKYFGIIFKGKKVRYINWDEYNKDEILTLIQENPEDVVFWKLTYMSICTIKRDTKWFETIKPVAQNFWNEVLEIKQNGKIIIEPELIKPEAIWKGFDDDYEKNILEKD